MADINLNFQGTPAPWVTNYVGYAFATHSYEITDGEGAIINHVGDVGSEVCEANMKLIAAAPELLEACIDRDTGETRTVGNSLQTLAFVLENGDTENIKDWIAFLREAGKKLDTAVCKALGLPNQ